MNEAEPTGPRSEWPAATRAWWMVAVLTLAYLVSFVDRTIISLLVDPIKHDLALTDTQVALLQGLAFGLFYALLGYPLGWLADKASRRVVVAAGATVWCVSTALSGLANNFWHLFLARVGVGSGEAALSPSAMSLMSDSFPPERRALPIGIYTAAAATGGGIAMMAGGAAIDAVSSVEHLRLPIIGELHGWQAAFAVVGSLGLIVPLLLLTIAEPARKEMLSGDAKGSNLFAYMRANRRFVLLHYASISTYAVLFYAVLSWVPAFYSRVFGWSASQIGLRYGLVLALFGGAGTVLGASATAALRRRGAPGGPIWVTAVSMAAAGLLMVPACLVHGSWVSLAWMAPAMAALTAPGATAIHAIQEAFPNQLRGQAAAAYYLVISVFGLTLGPLVVALLTDYVFRDPASVGKAIAWVCAIAGPLAGAIEYWALRPYRRVLLHRHRAAESAA